MFVQWENYFYVTIVTSGERKSYPQRDVSAGEGTVSTAYHNCKHVETSFLKQEVVVALFQQTSSRHFGACDLN